VLKHRGSNKLTVDGEVFRYVVGETGVPMNGRVPLALVAQHVESNGSRLRVTGLMTQRVPEEESKHYLGRTLSSSITPRDAERLLRLAIMKGWKPFSRGKFFAMQSDGTPAAG